MTDVSYDTLIQAVENYHQNVRTDFETAITGWPINLHHEIVHAVLGGLLARQCVLGGEFAIQPELWNIALGPLFIRSMVELYINFAWILLDPFWRCREFHLYGLGQAKLAIEYARSLEHIFQEKSANIKTQELWLNSQRHEMFTDVNVGLWSGKSLKEMAVEADIANSSFLYASLTGSAHGTWDHVFQLYLEQNPDLGAQPTLPRLAVNPDLLFVSARVLNDTFTKFIRFANLAQKPIAYARLLNNVSVGAPEESSLE